jgi:hypothetical protein
VIASYQMAGDHRWASPGNLYSTGTVHPMPGLNLLLRQPIPRIPMLPWRMEATADLRNMLPGTTSEFFARLKEEMKTDLRQEEILILERKASVL